MNKYLSFDIRCVLLAVFVLLTTNVLAQTIERQYARQRFVVNGVVFYMIRVDGGTFDMGATNEQPEDAEPVEKPIHPVTLDTYYIAETEVTQELWEAVMGCNPSHFKGNKILLRMYRGRSASLFTIQLSEIVGVEFRLPTEAEWEFAARGGNNREGYKYSGGNILDEVGWSISNSKDVTHPVKTKKGNELGVFDMSGNVLEWCNDVLTRYRADSISNPKGVQNGLYRVNRGGGYCNSTFRCRVSYRNATPISNKSAILGFRIAMSVQ
jgi:Uncharacterized conserved protein